MLWAGKGKSLMSGTLYYSKSASKRTKRSPGDYAAITLIVQANQGDRSPAPFYYRKNKIYAALCFWLVKFLYVVITDCHHLEFATTSTLEHRQFNLTSSAPAAQSASNIPRQSWE